jgi:DNA modification methylase
MTPYYQDDACTIYHGDCREILPTLGRFDLLLTDPPYGISLANHAKGKERSNRDWQICGDDSQEAGEQVLFITSEWPSVVFASPMRPWSGKWRQFLAWEKGEHVSGGGDPATCWKPNWELIQIRNTPETQGRRDGAVLRFQADKEDYKRHPSPKPVSLIRYLICKFVGIETIADPFVGSGTTLVAAKLEGRRAVGIELEERYCEIAANRLSQGVLF